MIWLVCGRMDSPSAICARCARCTPPPRLMTSWAHGLMVFRWTLHARYNEGTRRLPSMSWLAFGLMGTGGEGMYSLMLVFALLTQAADARGTWSIEPALGPNRTPIPGRIQFVFFLRGGITSRDTAFDPSVFRGLTPAQMASPVKTATRFEIVREAGTFVCEGYFEAGFGSGTYLF